MFKPMTNKDFKLLLNAVPLSEKATRDKVQTLLMQATYAAYRTDYKIAGFDAVEFNALLNTLEECRSFNKHAISVWIRKFAPVQLNAENGRIEINKQKSEKLNLRSLSEEDAANTFWAWATQEGATQSWYEFDAANKKAARAEFDLLQAENAFKALCKKLTGAQYGAMADALMRTFNDQKAAALILDNERHIAVEGV